MVPHKTVNLLPLLALLALLAGHAPASAAPAPAPTRTTITYTRDAAALAALWVDHNDFELLGGAKAPKFTGSAVSAGIIRWAPSDNHYMRDPYSRTVAVLSTGDVKWAISKTPYKGGDVRPSYPDIVNSNIKGSHDAVVLDFWVRAKKSEGGIVGNVQAASNEGSPAAIKLHGTGAKDMFHFEVDGVIKDSKSFERIWQADVDCEDVCRPPQPGQKMHYYATGTYYRETGLVKAVKGRDYHIKVRLADTGGDRLVDSALYLREGMLSLWG